MAFAQLEVKTFTLFVLAFGIMPAPSVRSANVLITNGEF